MLRATQLLFGVLDKFIFKSLYTSTSRLNVFEKNASISVVKRPLEYIYKLAIGGELIDK